MRKYGKLVSAVLSIMMLGSCLAGAGPPLVREQRAVL